MIGDARTNPRGLETLRGRADLLGWSMAIAACAFVCAIVLWPLAALSIDALFGRGGAGARADTVQLIGGPLDSGGARAVLVRSVVWSVAAACVGALLGWCAARALPLLRPRWIGSALGVLVLLPLALPPWLLYAGFWLSVGPGTVFGDIVERGNLVGACRQVVLGLALAAWTTAPAFAVFLARGRAMHAGDARLLAADGAGWRVRLGCAWARDWRLLASSVVASAAFLLGETTVFDLAFVPTYGVEIRSIDALGASSGRVLLTAMPMMAIVAVAVAGVAMLARTGRTSGMRERPSTASTGSTASAASGLRVRGLSTLMTVLCALLPVAVIVAPIALFVRAVADAPRMRDFLVLHGSALGSAILVASCAGAAVACVAVFLRGLLASRAGGVPRRIGLVLAFVGVAASLVPGTVVAIAAEAGYNHSVTAFVYDTPLVVALVLAGRALAIAGIVALALDGREPRTTRALRDADASGIAPRILGLRAELALAGLAAFPIALAWCLGELTASGRVIPPGFQWIATDILNAIHYQRPETVLFGSAALLGAGLVAMLGVRAVLAAVARGAAHGRAAVLVALAATMLMLGGCGENTPGGSAVAGDPSDAPTLAGKEGGAPGEFDAPLVARPLAVERVIGGSGRGKGQFNGPRVIAVSPLTGDTFVIDKDARVQRFDGRGEQLAEWRMPAFDRGKPTGASVAPDGNLVVADTHEHRIVCFSPDGAILWTLGEYGMEPGQFIYPTDVAFAPDGRMFIAEYGSNDRIQIFDASRKFLSSFGKNGVEPGEFLRPQSIVYDAERDELYISDVGNHRVQVFTGAGVFKRTFGRAGKEPGQLAYPFGLVLEIDGAAVVPALGRPAVAPSGPGRRTVLLAEHGNHRVQRLDAETGKALDMAGGLGTSGGRLKYPWAMEPAGTTRDGLQRYALCDHANARIVYFTFPHEP